MEQIHQTIHIGQLAPLFFTSEPVNKLLKTNELIISNVQMQNNKPATVCISLQNLEPKYKLDDNSFFELQVEILSEQVSEVLTVFDRLRNKDEVSIKIWLHKLLCDYVAKLEMCVEFPDCVQVRVIS